MPFKKPSVSFDEALAESRAERGLPPKPAPTPVASATPSTPPPARPRKGRGGAPAPSPAPVRTAGNVTINVVAPHPAPGVSPSFDAISADLGPERAMRATSTRAWASVDAVIASGALSTVPSYAVSGAVTETTRRIAPGLIDRARAKLDPHSVESQRTIGRALMTSALAAYFKAEKTTS